MASLPLLAGGEIEGEERLLPARANALYVVFDDRKASAIARLAQALEDLLRAVRVNIEPAHNLSLVRIELAHTRHAGARLELLHARPLGDRARVQSERSGGLRDAEPLATQVVADLAEELIAEHAGAPSDRGGEHRSARRHCSYEPVLVRAHAVAFLQAPALDTAVPDRR